MTESPSHHDTARPWFIGESADRWYVAACRFAPQLMPPPLVPLISRVDPSTKAGAISIDGPAVVLWEVQRSCLAAACDRLVETAASAPQALQWVAGPELTDKERVMLAELRCAAILRHPEDLPRLAAMVRAYFTAPDPVNRS